MKVRDRVKELRRVKASDLIPNPKNWRKHPRAQADALRGVLAEIGYADALLARETPEGLMLVDGHLRAETTPDAEVPVLVLDVTEEEADKMLLTLDPLAGMAEMDGAAVNALLESVSTESEAVRNLLDGLRDQAQKAMGPGEGLTDPDDVPEAPEEPVAKRGDVWVCGDHRVMCGDSTDVEDVAKLMAGETAALGLTSPPYAVGKEYEAGVQFTEHLKLLEGIADMGLTAIRPGGFFFVNFGEIAAQSHAGPLTGSKRQCLYPISRDYWRIFHEERGYDLYAQRVWYKPFNRLQQPFWTYHTSVPHYQEWEPIWTWRLPGGDGDECYDWDISSRAIWDTRQEATDDRPLTRHVAAFPVCLPERAMKAHSPAGALVWEPFLGSGTTMIAAERLGRRCYGMEIEPRYVDVAVKRWCEFTGREAMREGKQADA